MNITHYIKENGVKRLFKAVRNDIVSKKEKARKTGNSKKLKYYEKRQQVVERAMKDLR